MGMLVSPLELLEKYHNYIKEESNKLIDLINKNHLDFQFIWKNNIPEKNVNCMLEIAEDIKLKINGGDNLVSVGVGYDVDDNTIIFDVKFKD